MPRAGVTVFELVERVLVEDVARVRVVRVREGCCGKDSRTGLGRDVSDSNGRRLGGGNEMGCDEV